MNVRRQAWRKAIAAFALIAVNGCADHETKVSYDIAKRSDPEFVAALEYMRIHDPKVISDFGETNLFATYIEGRQ